MVLDGKSNYEIATTCPDQYIKFHGGINKMRSVLEGSGPERKDLKVEVLWGPPGSGKSTLAQKRAVQVLKERGLRGIYYRTMNGVWMDGYDGEEVIILEEMGSNEPDDFSFKELLLLCGPHPYMCKIKGASRASHARHIIMTSNFHPSSWFKDHPYNKGQLQWRLSLITKVVKKASSNTSTGWRDSKTVEIDHETGSWREIDEEESEFRVENGNLVWINKQQS